MSLPNLLSILRIMLIPVFAAVFFGGGARALAGSAAVLILSFLTDILDGYIARKYNQVTSLGKVLDPLADKLTQVAVSACLFIKGVIPLPVLLFFVIKEALILFGGAKIYADSSFLVTASWYGKVGTGLFYTVMALILLLPKINTQLKNLLIGIVILWALVVGIMYLIKFLKIKRQRA